jgi:hypothetical protein
VICVIFCSKVSHIGQLIADMGLDRTGIRVRTSNNCPTKPFYAVIQYFNQFNVVFNLYSILKNKTHMSLLCRLKITTREMYVVHLFSVS